MAHREHSRYTAQDRVLSSQMCEQLLACYAHLDSLLPRLGTRDGNVATDLRPHCLIAYLHLDFACRSK